MTELTLKGIGTAVKFGNGVCVLNTTPHPLTMQDTNGELVTVPTSVLINAKAEEKAVNDLFVKTVFVGTSEEQRLSGILKALTRKQDAQIGS